MLSRGSRALRASPLTFACGSATVKTFTADVMVQTVLEGKQLEELDRRRTAAFTLFGAAWMGCGQYCVHRSTSPPPSTHWAYALVKLLRLAQLLKL